MYIYYLYVLFCLPGIIELRGPHHPRGGEIVKRHVHYRPTKETGENLIHDDALLHDKEHIQEHLEDIVNEPDLTNMTDEQLEFYYFQFHDVDKNNKLDGLEIFQALSHIDHHDHEGGGDGEVSDDEVHIEDEATQTYYIELIDDVLKEDDLDQDGYISYQEYVAGRQKKRTINEKPSVKIIP